MNIAACFALLSAAIQPPIPGIVIRGGLVYDGSGAPAKKADIRIVGDKIRAIGKVVAKPGDEVIDASGLAVAPGFIDAHSHANGGIFEDPDAETQIRQGITTSVVGEDGSSNFPLAAFYSKIETQGVALNFASFVGHGSIRHEVIGDEDRKPTPAELAKMKSLVKREMESGALGLSTGLEYIPNRYATTAEIVELTKVAAKQHGFYISHIRNEDNQAFAAFAELVEVSKKAHVPGEINHIKLCSERVWHRAGEVLKLMQDAHEHGLDVTADVYPYLFWQSTIRVIIPTEDFGDRALWKQGLADVGGASHVRLTSFTPDPTWAGKTLDQISATTGKDPITLCQEIVNRCYGPGNTGSEGVLVTAMSEDDLETFISSPNIMFCSDGGLHFTHPRGAGSFPRVLGEYVREKKIIPLAEAIRKMTSLPAKRFGFKNRGMVAVGDYADLVLFDPATVKDTATVDSPESAPVGLPTVLVNGVPVLMNGMVTHRHPGRPLVSAGTRIPATVAFGPYSEPMPLAGGGGGG